LRAGAAYKHYRSTSSRQCSELAPNSPRPARPKHACAMPRHPMSPPPCLVRAGGMPEQRTCAALTRENKRCTSKAKEGSQFCGRAAHQAQGAGGDRCVAGCLGMMPLASCARTAHGEIYLLYFLRRHNVPSNTEPDCTGKVCAGKVQSGRLVGYPCTATAKANGYCGMHQNQAKENRCATSSTS